MIAPSPDWVIAVNSLSLLDESGQFKSKVEEKIYLYDAGTESGDRYSLSNPASNPRQGFRLISNQNTLYSIKASGDQKDFVDELGPKVLAILTLEKIN